MTTRDPYGVIPHARPPGPQLGLDATMKSVDRETALDLFAVLDGDRRSQEAVALIAADCTKRRHYRDLARSDRALIATIRHGWASAARQHRLERYAGEQMTRAERPRRLALLSSTRSYGECR